MLRTVVRTHGGNIFDGRRNLGNRYARQRRRRGDRANSRGEAGEIARSDRYRRRTVIRHGHRANRRRAKQANAVEFLRRIVGELLGQRQELCVVVGLVALALGDVTVQHLEFANALEHLTANLECTILSLQERNGIPDVGSDGALTDGRS